MALRALVDRLDPEDVLIALHQDGAGAVNHPVLELHLGYWEDGAFLPHVHVGFLETSTFDLFNQG